MNRYQILWGLLICLFASCSRPVANFTYQGNTKAPTRIKFENSSEKAETYEWNFGDGTTSQEAEPTHRYLNSGNYTVTLKATNQKNQSKVKAEKLVIESPKQCLVLLETDFGDMLIELFDATPKHQDNFIKLVEQGFFDSLLFHRIINGFMIQGGDPNSKGAKPNQPLGSGGPGYTIPAEFVDSLVHIKGMLAAARTGDNVNPKKNSSGSQFYIVQGRKLSAVDLDRMEATKGFRYSKEQREAYMSLGGTPQLDREYTVFGRVIEGLDVIDIVAQQPTGQYDRPREDIRMKITVIR
ncbi:MAG: hypothetical protein DHS20C18_52660 [Saprospiraceae bacterium]|nr:MAG: hypothetical protein DHS20C18_52660 [Saprospiraceae bacterium]